MNKLPRLFRNRLHRLFAQDIVFSRVLKNFGWLSSASVLSTGAAVLQSIILARMLGVEQFGVLTLVTTYSLTVNQFVDSRVWETAIKYVVQFREEGDVTRSAAVIKICYLGDIGTGTIAFILVIFTADWFAVSVLNQPDTAGQIRLFAFSILLMIPVGTSSALLRIDDRFRWLAYHNLGSAYLRVGGILIVWGTGSELYGVLWTYLIATVISTGFIFWLSQKSAARLELGRWWYVSPYVLQGYLRRIIIFTFFTNLTATSRIITSRADILILGWLGTAADVGFYRVAKSLADPLVIIISPMYNTVYPEISRLVSQRQFVQLDSLRHKLTLSMSILIVPICLILTVLLPWVIPLLYSTDYTSAILPSQILVWQVIWAIMVWFPGWMLSVERTRELAALNWSEAIIYTILLLALVSRGGSVGASIATVLRFAIWTVLARITYYRISNQLRQTDYDYKAI